MNTKETKKWLFQLLGITFFVQASTSLIGGLLFKTLESTTSIETTITNISTHTGTFYTCILLQFATAIVIVMLGVAIYETAGHMNKTLAKIALILYAFEALLVAIGQICLIGLVKAGELYLAKGDAGLLSLGEILLKCRHFSGEIAMTSPSIMPKKYSSKTRMRRYETGASKSKGPHRKV